MGKVELYRIGFPIKCMCPSAMLQIVATGSIYAPFLLNAAALSPDPIERMKFVMINALAYV